jgi:lipopolysaccharide/colanic/teichoic acid biosynthesis glycosyltransferase
MTKHQDTQSRDSHARVLARRRQSGCDFLLSDNEFRFSADCERMRVDRNGSVLSLLLIELDRHRATTESIAFLARVLEGRLRITDTPGLLNDGRVGVLLPDTPAEGAWKVASDISDIYPPGPERPQCSVLVYPEEHGDRTREAINGEKTDTPPVVPEDISSDFFFVKPITLWKRAVDIVGATVGLVTSAPIILVASAAIKATSRGPAFFTQEREGQGGRRFRMHKLRTMSHDAESRQQEFLDQSHQDGPAFKMAQDPRTTRLGRFLRWSSIDELPQFWNVLKGEMSLVGPRPLPTHESLACLGWQRRRLCVRPGITCIWQISGRGNVRFDDWVRMDLCYIKRRSLLEDIKILMLTLPSLLFHRGVR